MFSWLTKQQPLDVQPINICEYITYIVNFIHNRNIDYRDNVTKTIKLGYIVYGFVLAKYNVKIVNDVLYVGDYGPMFTNGVPAAQFLVRQIANGAVLTTPNVDKLPSQLLKFINDILIEYGKLTPRQVIDWTTDSNDPWYQTKNSAFERLRITDKRIKRYFRKLLTN